VTDWASKATRAVERDRVNRILSVASNSGRKGEEKDKDNSTPFVRRFVLSRPQPSWNLAGGGLFYTETDLG
jgi:hypothetical protein